MPRRVPHATDLGTPTTASGVHSGEEDANTEAVRASWSQIQLDLAQQVVVPRWEMYTVAPLPTVHRTATSYDAALDNIECGPRPGSFQGLLEGGSFVHTDFLLPTEELLPFLQHPSRGFREQLLHDIETQHHWREETWKTEVSPTRELPALRYIGGIDISFVPRSNQGVACLSILNYPALDVLHTFVQHCELTQPYVSGFLAFREVEPVVALFQNVRAELVEQGCMPQLLVVDGCGVHHPRRCGLASHLGVVLGIPSIGCAKKMLVVGDVTRATVEDAMMRWAVLFPTVEEYHGSPRAQARACPITPILVPSPGADGEGLPQLYGYAALTGRSAKTCIFISPGTRIGYAMAVALVLSMCRHKLPEPIRAADLSSREHIRQMLP